MRNPRTDAAAILSRRRDVRSRSSPGWREGCRSSENPRLDIAGSWKEPLVDPWHQGAPLRLLREVVRTTSSACRGASFCTAGPPPVFGLPSRHVPARMSVMPDLSMRAGPHLRLRVLLHLLLLTAVVTMHAGLHLGHAAMPMPMAVAASGPTAGHGAVGTTGQEERSGPGMLCADGGRHCLSTPAPAGSTVTTVLGLGGPTGAEPAPSSHASPDDPALHHGLSPPDRSAWGVWRI